MSNRKYGILAPISSLPSEEGIGTLGEEAYRFIDFLSLSGASVWQVLPLNPTNFGDSPYQSCSSDALNYYFIDLALLKKDGLLKEEEISSTPLWDDVRRVNYGKLFINKLALLRKAFSRFDGGEEFKAFKREGSFNDFAVFMALKSAHGHRAWTEWGVYRNFNAGKVAAFAAANAEEISFWLFTQYIFLKQWNALKRYANAHGVSIMGDIPLYVAYDSVEVWKYGSRLFKTDKNRNLTALAGCPPDAFTEDGQLWGNPVYDWKKMRKQGYKWWRKRIESSFGLFDILRIDHFRGFDRYWEVPAGHNTARYGSWQDGPKEELFKGFESYKIVAEDLGVIDGGVKRLMKNVGYPGMKVLIFAFDGNPENEHKPSNYTENFVCYTGTHDNMPLRQHIEDLSESARDVYYRDIISECALADAEADVSSPESATRSVIRLAFASKAETVIIPMNDILALGGESRINLPSTVSEENWSWRFKKEDFNKEVGENLRRLAQAADRLS
ncbi:MAG: 4-alpha-glucanotransferase [Clostridia bacterium]|nr:4-alpha-glucanotransferase [Clostridia bacterium]